MRTKQHYFGLSTLIAAGALAGISLPVQGAVIFSDSFEAPPTGDDTAGDEPTGYTVNDGESGEDIDIVVGSGTARTGSQQLNADRIGTQAEPFDQVGSSIERSFTLTPATDQNIQISMWARQAVDNDDSGTGEKFESDDFFEIAAGFGTDSDTYVYRDRGELDGVDRTFSSGGGTAEESGGGSENGAIEYQNYTINLPTVDSDGKTTLNLALSFNSNVPENEDYFVDDIEITSNIPEPASLALLGVGGLLMLPGRRNRA